MKNYLACEYKDLSPGIKCKVRNNFINEFVDFEIRLLNLDLEKNLITEQEYYNQLNCTKFYAESTSWFVPSCYYDKHKKEIDREVKKALKRVLFTKEGKFIDYN